MRVFCTDRVRCRLLRRSLTFSFSSFFRASGRDAMRSFWTLTSCVIFGVRTALLKLKLAFFRCTRTTHTSMSSKAISSQYVRLKFPRNLRFRSEGSLLQEDSVSLFWASPDHARSLEAIELDVKFIQEVWEFASSKHTQYYDARNRENAYQLAFTKTEVFANLFQNIILRRSRRTVSSSG